MASVTLSSLKKIYPNKMEVVRGINLEIKDGEFMVLVGPSGCGKSTTLRMIAGLEEISEGSLYIDGALVNATPPKDRNIAMVFQNYALYPHMTVYENIAFGLQLAKLPKDEIDNRVHEVAHALEIEHLLSRKPKDMSGGQRQRVALGRAIARRAKVYLFDEPLSNLDAQLRVAMRVRLAQLHQDLKNKGLSHTMIYVTHDQTEAMTLGHRICVMENGTIRQVDTPLNLYRYPANKFVAEFIGSPSMNFVHGELIRQGGNFFVDIGVCNISVPENKALRLPAYEGKKIGLGIRAEHICFSDRGFKSVISVAERMGNEDFIYFPVGKQLFVMRSSGVHEQVQAGVSESFFFDPQQIHLFDLETEENISIPREKSASPVPASAPIGVEELVNLLGGSANLKEIDFCTTRLRMTVVDSSKIKKDSLAPYRPIYANGGQVQIIFGKASEAYAAAIKKLI